MSLSNSSTRSAPTALWTLLLRVSLVIETAFFASLTAGAVVGLLGRLAMLLLTLAGGTSDTFVLLRFTLVGTVRIMVVPMLFGYPWALMIAALWRRLPGSTVRAKAVAAGLITFVFPGLLLLTDRSFKLNQVNQTFGLALFAALYFAFGFLVALAIDYWNQATARHGWHARLKLARWRWLLWAVLLIGLGVLFAWSDAKTFG